MLPKHRGSLPISAFTILTLILFLHNIQAEVIRSNEATQQITTQRPLRLPNTTYPLHYHLHVKTNIHLEDINYDGNVTIDVLIKESTNEIVLHSKNLHNFSIKVSDLATGEVKDDLTYSIDTFAHFLIIHPVENYQAFEAGQRYRVEILYKGEMYKTSIGLYWLTYSDANNQTVYLAATQFEPTSARLALPCYDEPAFKSNFTIKITHGSSYMAISNMQPRDVEIHNGDEKNLSTTTFYTTPPMSTYLVAFVISNFVYISEEFRGVTQRIFTAPDSTDKGYKALKNTVRTVAMFEDYFGVNFPLAKLDHIALQKNYGAAMENWGLITYKEDNLVHQADGDKHRQLRDILVQNHEIAHQWFGNLVSPEWWSYAWMNEGFATYFGYIVTDLLYPELRAMDYFLTDIAERAYNYGYVDVHPMTHYVEEEADIIGIFDIISYQRAACVIKMFHHAFNKKTFVRGINKFFSKFQYSVANEMQLFDSLQMALLEDDVMKEKSWVHSAQNILMSWTHSKMIPVVSIIRNYENNTITIRQWSNGHRSQELLWIPLNFATASAPDFKRTIVDYFMLPVSEVNLSPVELGISLQPEDWLIANKQQTGFFHVLYDDENLIRIAKVLQQNHTVIHPLNRAAIFQDLYSLLEANELKRIDVIFELLKYLRNEVDLLPWNRIADTINFLENKLYYSAHHSLFQSFVRYLVAPIFERLFKTQQNNLTHTDTLARQRIIDVACAADLPDCLEYTRNLAYKYIFNDENLGPDLEYYAMLDSILCLGLKYPKDDIFDAIMTKLSHTAQDSSLSEDLIYSLRCTQSQKHLHKLLNFLLGIDSNHSYMKDSESFIFLLFMYRGNRAARPVVLQFFEANYKQFSRSRYFIENLERMAEFVSTQHRASFLKLRDAIELELNANGSYDTTILPDPSRIGKKMRDDELFLENFGNQIQEWLLRELKGDTSVSAYGTRNGASRFGYSMSTATRLIRKLYQKVILF